MPPKRKHNPKYSASKTTVKSHKRTVYKRKPKSKFDISNFVKKKKVKPKRGKGLVGAAKFAVQQGGEELFNLWRGKYTQPGKSPQRHAASTRWGWRR